MSTFDEILENKKRIIVLYPSYNKISSVLENKFPRVRKVREDLKKYNGGYISPRNEDSCEGNDNPSMQFIELFIEHNGEHVEVMTALYRGPPNLWCLEKRRFLGHTLTSLPDSPCPWKDNSIIPLCKTLFAESCKKSSSIKDSDVQKLLQD